jgi:hypothetical protein
MVSGLPLILGGGRSLFNIHQRVNLKLLGTETYSTGLLFLKYAIE